MLLVQVRLLLQESLTCLQSNIYQFFELKFHGLLFRLNCLQNPANILSRKVVYFKYLDIAFAMGFFYVANSKGLQIQTFSNYKEFL